MRSLVGAVVLVSVVLLGGVSSFADSGSQSVFDDFVCGMHIGGRWGLNDQWVRLLPDSWFGYLHSLNASWVGISVSMTVDSSMDTSIEKCGADDEFATFSDSELRDLIRKLKGFGFKVYVTLAFESMGDGPAGQQVKRWQLGDPYIYREDASVWAEYWPWDPAHEDHEDFVQAFFASYGDFAVSYASLCEQEGVDLFSLGTETDRLFRTGSQGTRWPTAFRTELQDIVGRVKEVFAGAVTYDMLYSSLTDPYPSGLHSLWNDVGMDVIGISAYFHVLSSRAYPIPPTEQVLLDGWRDIFSRYLNPLAESNPALPMIFLEFGYCDVPGSAYDPVGCSFEQYAFSDRNSDGLDDGEQEQAAILSSFFDVLGENPGTVDGIFTWGEMVSPPSQWENTYSFGCMRHNAIRGNLAEEVVRDAFDQLGGELEVDSPSDDPVRSDEGWARIPYAVEFSTPPNVEPDAAEAWYGEPGRNVHGIKAHLENGSLLLRVDLCTSDVLGSFEYLITFRHPTISSKYLVVITAPGDDCAKLDYSDGMQIIEVGYVCNEFVSQDERSIQIQVPESVYEAYVGSADLAQWPVSLCLRGGLKCEPKYLYFFPGTALPSQDVD